MHNLMPIACGKTTSCNKVVRKVLCRHYGTCLDYAIQKEWEGFSCEQCSSYECLELNEEEWREDYSRCLALLYFARSSRLKLQVNDRNSTIRVKSKNAQSTSCC